MFAFEIWGKFASFRDPFTISQNISLPIPPKTTVAGMMASILGEENYFDDEAFRDFEYSVIVVNPVVKKSFTQNYINDYTKFTSTHIDYIRKGEYEKLAKYGLRRKLTNKKWTPQTQTNRELLLNPKYLIIVKGFKYEEKLTTYLKNRMSKFPFYLGNSEFAGNFSLVEIKKATHSTLEKGKINSFILESDLNHIDFEEGVRYSTITFSTVLNRQRTPLNVASIVLGSKAIRVKNLTVDTIECENRVYHCRFL